MIALNTPVGRILKRSVDLMGASLGLLLLLPLFLVVAIFIRMDTPGPVFFRQTRVGRGGRLFRMWKFRSMGEGADETGPGITGRADPRITRVGSLLRRTKVDELPQLINVLRGEMSLVGPRPEVPEYVALYSPEEMAVLEARPGITDPASLAYRGEERLLAEVEDPEAYYTETLMHEKLVISLRYLRTATLGSDVRVLLGTLVGLFR